LTHAVKSDIDPTPRWWYEDDLTVRTSNTRLRGTAVFLYQLAITGAFLVNVCWCEETLSSGPWQLSAEKGEVTRLTLGGTAVLKRIGGFRVAGKDVRPFIEVTELREKTSDQIVYEGIADARDDLYVEFGQVIKAGKDLEYLLFLWWLPPGCWPPDAVEGVVDLAPAVLGVERLEIDPGQAALTGTQDFRIKMKGGKLVRLRITGADPRKTTVVRRDKTFQIRFEESRDYLESPLGRGGRHMSYWVSSTDEHHVKFTFSVEK